MKNKVNFLQFYSHKDFRGVFECLSTSERGYNWKTKYIADMLPAYNRIDKCPYGYIEEKCLRLANLYSIYCDQNNITPQWEDSGGLLSSLSDLKTEMKTTAPMQDLGKDENGKTDADRAIESIETHIKQIETRNPPRRPKIKVKSDDTTKKT